MNRISQLNPSIYFYEVEYLNYRDWQKQPARSRKVVKRRKNHVELWNERGRLNIFLFNFQWSDRGHRPERFRTVIRFCDALHRYVVISLSFTIDDHESILTRLCEAKKEQEKKRRKETSYWHLLRVITIDYISRDSSVINDRLVIEHYLLLIF